MKDLIASGLGLGHLRPAPGTWASAAALIAAWLLLVWGGLPAFLVALVLGLPLALWSISGAITGRADQDPTWVVIDEVLGQWIALLPVAWGAWSRGMDPLDLWPGWIAAFLLFRLIDIAKPGPVGRADRRGGTAGVLLDDILAGLLAALGVLVLGALYHIVLFG